MTLSPGRTEVNSSRDTFLQPARRLFPIFFFSSGRNVSEGTVTSHLVAVAWTIFPFLWVATATRKNCLLTARPLLVSFRRMCREKVTVVSYLSLLLFRFLLIRSDRNVERRLVTRCGSVLTFVHHLLLIVDPQPRPVLVSTVNSCSTWPWLLINMRLMVYERKRKG